METINPTHKKMNRANFLKFHRAVNQFWFVDKYGDTLTKPFLSFFLFLLLMYIHLKN